ncbi:DNA polymerase I [Aestuariispira insulae]|uniref:DNA polymerase I n=1 Tax=Aestuariispira insulae TaxID=1461337 RepID=A0A3D9H9E9_9PROT|nr:DNA polymerase I [Aestuariispira insulae]RED46120.1 DNA polymerase I [Aestuariispira insulae]
MSAPRHVYLIDGSSYIFRAFFGLPPMNRPDGTPTNAVFGFCTMVFKLVEETDADYVGVIFDKARQSFRNDIYPDYKSHRPPAPEDLVPQFPLIREAVEAFNLPGIDMDGFEADDLIATYARQAREAGAEVTIVSSDKDLMQLVGDGINMWDPMKNKTIGPDEVREKFGVGPERVVDVQALAGDTADNVPGVEGIGIKTAAQLINEYGDLETLLERAGEIKQPKRRERLTGQADMARVSKELVTLRQDIEVETPLTGLERREIDHGKLLTFLKEQGFKRLIAKFEAEEAALNGDAGDGAPKVPEKTDYQLVQKEEDLIRWVREATLKGTVAVDTETTSVDQNRAELVGVSLCVEAGTACYIPLAHKSTAAQGDLLGGGEEAPEQIPFARAIEILKPMLEDPSVLKIGQNIKYDMTVLARNGINVAPIDDTMLISFVLEGGSHGHGMDELSELHLDIKPIKFEEVAGKGKSQVTFDYVDLDKARDYAAEDADITLRLWQKLKPELLSERLSTIYETIERPLAPVLSAMEREGILVDPATLKQLSEDFSKRIEELQGEIHEMAGKEFNVGSPKQLGEVLFGDLGLPGGKKTKTGGYSTNAEVLEGLAHEHAIVAKILEWRTLSKLRSTYTDALLKDINPETGRVHTSYMMTGAQTGRLSSTDPNLQNIPVRTEEGRKIREAFIAKPGHKLISLDYSQIELRLVAEIAGLETMREAFRNDIDIHAMTASEVFGVPLEGMDPIVRRQAKAVNFGIIYGISAFGLANQLGVSRGDAKAFIEAYFERFSGIRRFMDDVVEGCRAKGYVETLFGRRIHLGSINDKNPMKRNYAERQAINAPIQGTAADIIKRAMIRIPGALEKAGMTDVKMLLQVHDELIFEAPEDKAEAVVPVVRDIMENAARPVYDLSVPLVVDGGIADNWREAH